MIMIGNRNQYRGQQHKGVRHDRHCQRLTISTSTITSKSSSCDRTSSYGGSFVSRVFIFVSLSTTLLSFCSARDCHTSFRRPWRDLSCQDQDDFLQAIIMVKESGSYDEFIDVHLTTAQFSHGPAEFLPWHRWYIWNFEKLLQEATGRCIYIPYWDWERDAEWESESDIMHPATFGAWGATSRAGCTVDGLTNYHAPFRFSPGVDNGPDGCVTRDFLEGFSFSGEAQIVAMITNYDQYADTTGNAIGNDQHNPAEVGTTNGFRTEFENGPHMLVHGIIAGHMGTNWSPSDPLFYLHHSNVDRIWTMWQDYWDYDECPVEEYYAPWHYDSARALDRRLPFQAARGVSSWDFRMWYSEEDSEPGFPTVRDVMSNDGPEMSVKYQNSYLNNLIPGYEPNSRLFQVADDFVGVKCNRDEWEMTRRRNLEQSADESSSAIGGITANTTSTIAAAASTLMNQNHTDQILMNSHEGPIKPSKFYRSSLRGNDAQEIEDDDNFYYRTAGDGRVKSNLDRSDIVDVTIAACARPPVFTLKETRDEWDRLCLELPASTPMADRLALLAESDCNRKGNPRSDAPELRERVSMTMMKAFDAPSSAYECFHRPDRLMGDRR
mmetsp:Transcript_24392/g.27292  ORF Transcript_24392/g.27292 Transcript_24392/m.27292 type:complete len:608 (-) Transcript_24392:236-2059(-)